ncbi:MAG: hypothetical protein ACKVOX_18135 [Rhizobacter sp.]
MLHFRSHALLTLCLFAVAATAHAENAVDQRFDNRQDRQEQRIEKGATSGALTQPEVRRLSREQARLTRAEGRAEADGKVTPKEAIALEKRQDVASRRIFRQKHDAQTRQP